MIDVDDGGDPPLGEVVAPFESNLTLTLLRQANGGPAAARNAGAKRARGEFLAFTDDDCLPEPGWLTGLAEALSGAPDCMVGGAILNAWSFSRQHFGYGRGAERFHRLRAIRVSGSLLADSRFHLDIGNWLHYPLTTVPRRQVVPVAALLMLWQATNLAGFLWETIRRNLSTFRDRALSPSR